MMISAILTAGAKRNGLVIALIILSLLLFVFLCLQLVFVIFHMRFKRSSEHAGEIEDATGVGNRLYLLKMYSKIPAEKRPEYAVICFYLDSEHIEGAFGRDTFVSYLRYCVETISEYATPDDIIARVNGPGLISVAHVTDNDINIGIRHILRKIRTYVSQLDPLFAGDIAAGIYRLRADDYDIHQAVFNAWQTSDLAADEAKDFLFCTGEMVEQFMEERSLRTEIGRGFDNHEFVTYIQFCVDAATGKIVGGEALSRWQHPEKGILSPAKFIPFMEREDIISRMDYYNLEEVCKFLEEVASKGITEFFVSCNFSRKTYAMDNFVDICSGIISKYEFPRNMLVFEITESAVEKNVEQINKNSVMLKELGLKILLDDFGEGFASFYDLHEYPIDGLKLDKALVDRYNTRKGNAIIRGMTRMGHEMNLTVVVEGVENDDQVKELRNIKCDIIQGFRFHRPIPVAAAKATLYDSYSVPAS